MNNCLFCKIVNGDIPSQKIYEDEDVYAFLDISPATKGHTLVIPKKHVVDIFDMDPETAAKVFSVVPKISKALKDTFNPIGLNIVNNNRKPYQVVFHYHIHLIPRYENDGYLISSNNKELTQDELEAIKHSIIDNIK
ncbi:HIT family protein [Mycoplasmatota bacterium]|nr:HIT family protein [Mycoplasmatota bacterium]